MVNISAQTWLNKNYPEKGVCKNENDQKNKNKERGKITELYISKGEVEDSSFNSGSEILVGSLDLTGFTKLEILKVSFHQITELDVSGCKNLKELDCQNNQLIKLVVEGCSELIKINCNFNNFLERVDVSDCKKLSKVGFGFNFVKEKKNFWYRVIQ